MNLRINFYNFYRRCKQNRTKREFGKTKTVIEYRNKESCMIGMRQLHVSIRGKITQTKESISNHTVLNNEQSQCLYM